jgi:hypothetical protein
MTIDNSLLLNLNRCHYPLISYLSSAQWACNILIFYILVRKSNVSVIGLNKDHRCGWHKSLSYTHLWRVLDVCFWLDIFHNGPINLPTLLCLAWWAPSTCWVIDWDWHHNFQYSIVGVRYHPRLFVQIGHETTYAAIRNHQFFTVPSPSQSAPTRSRFWTHVKQSQYTVMRFLDLTETSTDMAADWIFKKFKLIW